LHETSPHNEAELDGFREALDANGVDSADFLSVGRSYTRLFRDGGYPTLRGTFLSLDRRTHALYTRGSVDFFATYPGMYVPSGSSARRSNRHRSFWHKKSSRSPR
jgi:hypothetical protein